MAVNFIVLAFFYSGSYRSSHVGEYLYQGKPEELWEGESSEGVEQPNDEINNNKLSGLDGLDIRVQSESKWVQLN